jgi:molybdopterin synthase sulfur carrier subunit
MIEVLYFARLREQVGRDRESMPLPPGVVTLGDLTAHLCTRGNAWADVFGGGQRVMMAVNQEVARRETVLRDGDEVAYFPPVTGG